MIAVNLNTDMHQPGPTNRTSPCRGLLSQWLNRGEREPSTPACGGDDGLHQHHAGAHHPCPDGRGSPEIQLCPRLGNLSIMDFHRASDAINEGEACVERNLEQLKEELSRLCLI